jgi:DNA-binding winged helix-turn-helix (wHTH) protein
MEVHDRISSLPMVIQINDVVVDLTGKTLRDARGTRLTLRPQSFAILRHLVTYSDGLVTKGQLIEAVWHGAAVIDDSVVRCIHEIRRIPRADQRLQTVPKRGYRLNLATRGPGTSGSYIARPALGRRHSRPAPSAPMRPVFGDSRQAFTTSSHEPKDEYLAAGLADACRSSVSSGIGDKDQDARRSWQCRRG